MELEAVQLAQLCAYQPIAGGAVVVGGPDRCSRPAPPVARIVGPLCPNTSWWRSRSTDLVHAPSQFRHAVLNQFRTSAAHRAHNDDPQPLHQTLPRFGQACASPLRTSPASLPSLCAMRTSARPCFPSTPQRARAILRAESQLGGTEPIVHNRDELQGFGHRVNFGVEERGLAELQARDGAVITEVAQQLRKLPGNASRLVARQPEPASCRRGSDALY